MKLEDASRLRGVEEVAFALLAEIDEQGESLAGQGLGLRSRIQAAVEEAVSTWPELQTDLVGFVRHITAGLGPPEVIEERLALLRPADLYLAWACARGEARAMAIFEQRHLSLVPAFLAHLGESETFVEEVRQCLREKLLVGAGAKPGLLEYRGVGRLENWVRVVAIRTAINLGLHEKKHRPGTQALAEDALCAEADPELAYIRRLYQPQFREAFEAAFETLPLQARNVLRLHVLDGLNLSEISVIYSVHRSSVTRWVAQARADLLRETRRRLRQLLHGTQSEIESTIRLVASEIDINLRGLLTRASE
jgi:RNA polymerase sigma-70 factor (ECF subfamily)